MRPSTVSALFQTHCRQLMPCRWRAGRTRGVVTALGSSQVTWDEGCTQSSRTCSRFDVTARSPMCRGIASARMACHSPWLRGCRAAHWLDSPSAPQRHAGPAAISEAPSFDRPCSSRRSHVRSRPCLRSLKPCRPSSSPLISRHNGQPCQRPARCVRLSLARRGFSAVRGSSAPILVL